ncbi:MAG: helix-turn-helix domain-containing protein [Bacteroidales bacterium]|nr:helix-turn-helix domain-containing protein [Bacteroidales bacterium]MCB9013855.1 helix-turn-helix domain-containing protein [Bacteroidales bacterium]
MYFNTNLKLLRKRRGKTQEDLAAALGMKRPTLGGYENNVARPGIDELMKFSAYFRIAIDTLIKVDLSKLTGNQLYQLENGQDVFINGNSIRILATTVTAENKENIELVPEKAKAGYTNGFSDPEYISELPVFHLPFLSENKKYRTFQLNGDSMLPIPDKSWVTGEFVQDWNNILSGDAYIILTLNEGIVFKIADNHIREDGLLTLYSLNTIYEPFHVHVHDIREVWKFVHYISAEIPDPVMPKDELFRTVAGLKQDMEALKTRVGLKD